MRGITGVSLPSCQHFLCYSFHKDDTQSDRDVTEGIRICGIVAGQRTDTDSGRTPPVSVDRFDLSSGT
jgi:hypothetical protein